MSEMHFLEEPPDICAACGQPAPFLEPGSSRVSVFDEHGWQMFHRDCFYSAAPPAAAEAARGGGAG